MPHGGERSTVRGAQQAIGRAVLPRRLHGPRQVKSSEEVIAIAEPPSPMQVRDEIAREILRIHEESYGGGAATADAIVTDDWVVVILDDLELLPNEEFLVERGEADTVTDVRTRYQHAIQSSFRAAVERATGRTVVGFASTSSVEDPRFGAEIFKLG